MSPYAGDLLAVIGFDAPYIQAQIRHMQPVSSFRSRFGYVNNLFLVAAEVIRRHTGMTWEEAVQRRLFAPLGMTKSSTGLPAYRSAANAAFSHTMLDGQIIAMPMDVPSLGWAYTYGPAGGVNSTVVDMAKWLRLHLSQGMYEGVRLISEANMQVVHSPKTAIEPQPQNPLARTPLESTKVFYCEGWVYSAAHPYPVIWHNGDTGGIHTVGPRRVQMTLRHWNRDTLDDADDRRPTMRARRVMDLVLRRLERCSGWPAKLFQFHHQPFAYFARYAPGMPERGHLKDEADFFRDLATGSFPAVAFVKPIGDDNEHPGYSTVAAGQQQVAKLVKAVQDSPIWPHTVIIVSYDEHGGRWDHVPPPIIDRWGPGLRVPTVIISLFAKKGFVDHTPYETVSILKFIETRWDLPPLDARDRQAADLTPAFEF